MTGKESGLNARVILIILIVLAVFFGWLGYQPGMLINEYARGLALTLLGVALVVSLTDYLARKRDDKLFTYLDTQRRAAEEVQAAREATLLRSQLIREVASGDSGLASRAIKELDEHGWLTDGTLANSQLSGANLRGVALAWANLSGAFLSRINLEEAELSYANFSSANLSEARLARANLDLANLIEADLSGSDLSLVSLKEADLTGAHLEEANFSGATMIEATLNKVQAERASFNGADLERANLVEANLSDARLERANLSSANMGWVNLSRANLERANLSEANLSGANLDDARLNGADLSGAFLYGARVALRSLSTVKSLAHATMPDGLKYEDWVRRQSGEEPLEPITTSYAPAPEQPESPLDYVATEEEI